VRGGSDSNRPVTDQLREDLFGTDPETPGERAALVMVESHSNLLIDLRKARRSRGLSRAAVAERMGVTRKKVEAFESYWYDPKLSEIRRYALAIGVVVVTKIDIGAPAVFSAPAADAPEVPLADGSHQPYDIVDRGYCPDEGPAPSLDRD
jgi:transcriptional regulator with XRE-family HTH domain